MMEMRFHSHFLEFNVKIENRVRLCRTGWHPVPRFVGQVCYGGRSRHTPTIPAGPTYAGHQGWNELHAVKSVQKIDQYVCDWQSFEQYRQQWCTETMKVPPPHSPASPRPRIDPIHGTQNVPGVIQWP